MTKYLYKDKSKIRGAGNGLFAKKIFRKGEIVCEYHGLYVTKEQIYESYTKNKDNYMKKIHPYIRDISNDKVVIGMEEKDLFKSGVLVNDFKKLYSKKITDIMTYVRESMKNKNVDIVIDNKTNKPYYVATKRIKKGNEFYAHYGIGFWLLGTGMSPSELSKMDKDLGGFNKFYKRL